MINVLIPDWGEPRELVFYLALEEYLSNFENKDFFFIWQSAPTVIIGRNQILENEVNTEFCLSNSIKVYRRKSGGGCVYSDKGNLMISCITSKKTPEIAFSNYLDKLSDVLKNLGFQAVKTSNNDLIIQEKKISGNAYFGNSSSSIVHGTLLFNMNLEMMGKAITPSHDKIFKHGIKSVRQRVVNLKELDSNLSIKIISDKLIEEFCDSEYFLSRKDIEKVKLIEKTYLDPEFIQGK